MPTGYTAKIYDGKDATLGGFLRECARGFILDMKDAPADAAIPERSTYKDEVIANHEQYVKEALDTIYRLEGMTDAQCDAEAKAHYDTECARFNEMNAERAAIGERYRAVLTELDAWDAPPPLHALRDFMRDQLVKSIEFDCEPFDLPPAPLSGAEWRAREIAHAQQMHARWSEDLVKQREMKVRGDAFMAALHGELRRL